MQAMTNRLVVLVGVVVIGGCSHAPIRLVSESNLERYREADIRLYLQKDPGTLLGLLDARSREEFVVAGADTPGRQEVLLRLSSRLPTAREEGLVIVIARKWIDDEVLDAIFASYDPASSFLARLYVARVMNLLEPAQVSRQSSRLAALIRSERDERIRSSWFAVIKAMALGDAVPVLEDFMVSGSPLLQRMAYAVTSSMGPPATSDLRRRLDEMGAFDALRLMSIVDAGEGLPR